METKHTKGEWEINKHSATTVQIKGLNRTIASTGGYQVNTKESESIYNENIANAKLIAAAPDLLDALNRCRSLLEQLGYGNGNVCEKAIAAIKKATT